VSTADEDYAFGLYPDGSGVLRNRFGLRDAATLQAVEYQVTANRERDAPVFPPTREGYQALHRHLFQEVFDWAGELRTVNFTKGGSRFGTARYLDTTLDTLFTELASRDHLRGRTGERFAEGVAHHVSELNVAHPFRVMLNCKRDLSAGHHDRASDQAIVCPAAQCKSPVGATPKTQSEWYFASTVRPSAT